MHNTGNITAVVLCGGLGTRLRSVSDNLPKPMVNVAGRPFLEYILDYLIEQGVNKAVLAVSYRKEAIINHFGSNYKSLNVSYSIESSPLGTGGAVKKSVDQILGHSAQPILVINGDTLVEYELVDMLSMLNKHNADLVMSLKTMSDSSRYGRVKISGSTVTTFEEKKGGQPGLINAGVYLFSSRLRDEFPKPESFSFENDFLEKITSTHNVQASIIDGYFIDIGVPDDYDKAQVDFSSLGSSGSNLLSTKGYS